MRMFASQMLPMAPVSGPNSLGVDRNHPRKLTSRIYRSAAPPSFGSLGRVSFRRPLGVSPWYLHAPIFLYSVAAALVRVWVLHRFILSRTVVAVHRFVKPQLVRLIIICRVTSFELRFFRVLACVLRCACMDYPSWRGQPGRDTVDNQRSCGAKITGFGS